MSEFNAVIIGEKWAIDFINKNAKSILLEVLELSDGKIHNCIKSGYLYLSFVFEPCEPEDYSDELEYKIRDFMSMPGLHNCLIITDYPGKFRLWSKDLHEDVDFENFGNFLCFLIKKEMSSAID